MTTLVIIAKECLPGRVKTRLMPALTAQQAAELAAASLHDTLSAVASLPATRRVLAYDGVVPPEGSADYEIVQQVGGGLDERLAAVFDGCAGPTVLIGMDTPQLSADLLAPLFAPSSSAWSRHDAWFAPANDGGFWALGLASPDGSLLRGVPMSRADTGALQRERLLSAGLRVGMLPELTDVDTIEEARTVAEQFPDGSFAATLRRFELAHSSNADSDPIETVTV